MNEFGTPLSSKDFKSEVEAVQVELTGLDRQKNIVNSLKKSRKLGVSPKMSIV